MRDYLTGREINIKEKVLVVGQKVYAKESYVSFDTSRLEGYPPKVYYDREENYLGQMYDIGVFELEDIEDLVESYADTCFSNHDLDDIRRLFINIRRNFYESLENNKKNL